MNDFRGKKIAITRPIERSPEAIKIIEDNGGTVLVAPTLELVIINTKPLKDLCRRADELDWLIFTSPTAILSLFKHCSDLKDRLNPSCRIAVIGPRTGKYLSEHGLEADIIPEDYTAEGLLEIFEDIDVENQNIGLPRTLAARDMLPEGLKNKGANVFLVEAYKSDLPQDRSKVNEMVQAIINREVDAVTFTSTLTASNLFEMADGKDKERLLEPLLSGEVLVAAIGPVTARALEKYGITTITPDEYTVKAMLDKLMEKMD
ncbi:MAG TPA: uroporphyrinogen-III synthase [Methanobacterium sp.]|jgi:uroporphyrinogen-III synthase|nr:MAG: uroporphyrinogen-III synthase [Methanobacterium sp.]HOI71553.1 uroporphyrinogen-III synthase [Methanobacterium sp.]HPX78077.1 uroporphyrinogen-III synthase [Methanobacterium sp.]